MEGGEDLYRAILLYITTPLNHSLPSPTELLKYRKCRCLLPLQIRQQNHIQQYRNMMQHQKHEQAKHYNKSTKDLPSLKTENSVYVQLVPNVRKWIPGIDTERVSTRSYKIKTIKGGVYIRNRKFIRIRYTDLRQSLTSHREQQSTKPQHTYRKAQANYKKATKTNRVHKLYQNMGHTKTDLHKRLYP